MGGPPSVAAVFDIDGVLLRGPSLLPGAHEAISQIKAAGIPHIFVTNSGHTDETCRGESLSKSLGLPVLGEHMILCHSSVRACPAELYEALPELQDKLVLVAGKCSPTTMEIMKGYGYNNVRTLEDFGACHPNLVPHKPYDPVTDTSWAQQPVAALALIDISRDWHEDLQLCLDLLRSDGHVHTVAADGQQHVRLLHCNQDFTFPGAHPEPRLGPGAFLAILESLFLQLTGRTLEAELHGKPQPRTYAMAEAKLLAQLQNSHGLSSLPPGFKIWAVGDNPASDIRGARRAGPRWQSVLVRTGVWRGEVNDEHDPADHVVQDVQAAVHLILRAARHEGGAAAAGPAQEAADAAAAAGPAGLAAQAAEAGAGPARGVIWNAG